MATGGHFEHKHRPVFYYCTACWSIHFHTLYVWCFI